MPTADLSKKTSVDTSKDSIIIVNLIEDIPGGRTLDVTDVTADTLSAGHVIIANDTTGDLKPMPVSGNAYDAKPAGHTYKGVLVASILKSKPFASVLVRGTVNEVASPYPVTAAIKTALPLIRFTQD